MTSTGPIQRVASRLPADKCGKEVMCPTIAWRGVYIQSLFLFSFWLVGLILTGSNNNEGSMVS